jgi:hypothetical protein
MMRVVLVACVVLVPSLAAAKPLPAGMKVALVKQKLMVSRDGVSVPLVDTVLPIDKLKGAQLSEDGKDILVTYESCGGMGGDDGDEPVPISLAHTEARIENVLGMGFHNKKQYAEAIKHFTIAAAKDTATPLYATNLLSAQSMSGKLDDADKTIATYGKTQVPWFAWRLAVDPELKALRTRPSAKLGPAKRGTATSKLDGKIAYSPLGLAASEVAINIYDGIPSGGGEYELAIVDVATGVELLRLPTEIACDLDPESVMNADDKKPPKYADKNCPKREAARTAAKRKVADAVLADLGFDVVANAYVDIHDKDAVTAPDGRKLVLGDKPKLVAGRMTKDVDVSEAWAVGFVPKGLVIVNREGKHMTSCADGARRFSLSAYATP